MTELDIIICGGGMSGLSLAYYLSMEPSLAEHKILIIDPEKKHKNDRTWGFWENGSSVFDPILSAQWSKVRLKGSEGAIHLLNLENYSYKLLRGIDFYDFVLAHLSKCENIKFAYETVLSINELKNGALVKTAVGDFFANWVFDSTFKLNLKDAANQNMLQHFKGAVIECKEDTFDSTLPDLMDFSVPQHDGEARFIYVLPFTARRALIEYTVFGEELLSQETYDRELFQYLDKNINSSYEVLEEEFGVIPMSDVPTAEFPSEHVIRIGIAGGSTNPATGYTFANTQKRLRELVKFLIENGTPIKKQSLWSKRHTLYASVLLNVLLKKRLPAAKVFEELFVKNTPSQVFKFLGGETTFIEELKIMSSTRIKHFGAAAIEVLKSKLLR